MNVTAGEAFSIIKDGEDDQWIAFKSGEVMFYPLRFVVKKMGRLALMQKHIDGTVKRCRRNYSPEEFTHYFEIFPMDSDHEILKRFKEQL